MKSKIRKNVIPTSLYTEAKRSTRKGKSLIPSIPKERPAKKEKPIKNKELFTKGFNFGYITARYSPDILKTILNGIKENNDYKEGIIKGAAQFRYEESWKVGDPLPRLKIKIDSSANKEKI